MTLCCHLVKTVITIDLELLFCLMKAGAVESHGPVVCTVLIPVSKYSQNFSPALCAKGGMAWTVLKLPHQISLKQYRLSSFVTFVSILQ